MKENDVVTDKCDREPDRSARNSKRDVQQFESKQARPAPNGKIILHSQSRLELHNARGGLNQQPNKKAPMVKIHLIIEEKFLSPSIRLRTNQRCFSQLSVNNRRKKAAAEESTYGCTTFSTYSHFRGRYYATVKKFKFTSRDGETSSYRYKMRVS